MTVLPIPRRGGAWARRGWQSQGLWAWLPWGDPGAPGNWGLWGSVLRGVPGRRLGLIPPLPPGTLATMGIHFSLLPGSICVGLWRVPHPPR